MYVCSSSIQLITISVHFVFFFINGERGRNGVQLSFFFFLESTIRTSSVARNAAAVFIVNALVVH